MGNAGGILGIFHLDGSPLDPAELQAMASAGTRDRADQDDLQPGENPPGTPCANTLWWDGPIGLGVLGQSQPLHSPRCPGLTLVAAARLDDRAGLAQQLGLPSTDLDDSDLLLRAYEQWGPTCPEHLLGDWALALYDATQQALFLARDHFGSRFLYYHPTPRRLAFASSLPLLLSLPGIPRQVDESVLALRLVGRREHDGSLTAYRHLRCLPPAHCLSLGAGGQLQVQRYWRLEDVPPLQGLSDDGYAQCFVELFQNAVRSRLPAHGQAGLLLSSGLDSAAVAAIAAPLLASQGRRLFAFSSIPLLPAAQLPPALRRGDESAGIRAICKHVGNIDPHLLTCAEVSPIAGLRRALDLTAEPQHAAGNFFWILALLQTAQQTGVTTLLSGQHGNLTISWSATGYFAHLAQCGDWRRLGGELRRLVAAQRISWLRAVGGRVIRPLFEPAWQRAARRLTNAPPPWLEVSAIHPAFAARLQLDQLLQEEGAGASLTPQERRLATLGPAFSKAAGVWQDLCTPFGLQISDPTADQRLMSFCFAIPTEQFVGQGWERLLLRRALSAGRRPEPVEGPGRPTPLLPDYLLWARQGGPLERGRQAADLVLRLRAAPDEMESTLDEVERCAAAQAMLDLPRMRRTWQAVQTLESTDDISSYLTNQCANLLLRGLMAGLFLSRL